MKWSAEAMSSSPYASLQGACLRLTSSSSVAAAARKGRSFPSIPAPAAWTSAFFSPALSQSGLTTSTRMRFQRTTRTLPRLYRATKLWLETYTSTLQGVESRIGALPTS